MKRFIIVVLCMSVCLLAGNLREAHAYNVTLSMYNQGFNVNEFYDNGDFSVDNGIVNSDPKWLLVVIGDPANVEDIFETTGESNPFELELAGADFHFEVFQPYRFPDRFDGLFSTTVDDPVLLVFDTLPISDVEFRDDGILADDRLDLSAYSAELPESYFEVDTGDVLYLTMQDGTRLRMSDIVRHDDFSVSFDISEVPEPGTLVLVGIGLIGLIGGVKNSRNKSISFTSSLFLLLSIGLAILIITPAYSFAYEVGEGAGPLIAASMQAEYHSVLGSPTTLATRQCRSYFGDVVPYPNFATSCPPGYAEEWYQKFRNGIIECYQGRCQGSSIDPGIPDNPPSLEPPKLISVIPPACAGVGGWGREYNPSKHEFDLQFSPYQPTSEIIVHFSPSSVRMDSPSFIKSVLGLENSITQLDFSLTGLLIRTGQWFMYIDSWTKDAAITVKAGDQTDQDKYGTADTTVTLVNESASASFQVGATPFGLAIELDRIAKFIKDANKIIEKFNSFEKVLNELKKLPQSKWDFKKSLSNGLEDLLKSLSANVGVELSKQCCTSAIKTKYKAFGGFGAELVNVGFDSPRVPLGYGFFAGITGQLGVNFSANTSGETTCLSFKICFNDTEIDVDFGGGFYGEFLDEVIARAELKLLGRVSVEDMKMCYEFGRGMELKDIQVCIAPKVAGEVKLFSFVKTSVEANLGRKACL